MTNDEWTNHDQERPSAMNEHYASIIAGLPLFKGYTPHGTQRLLNLGEVKERKAGELIFKEGDKPSVVFLVLTGRLQAFVERKGRDLILDDAGPGTIIGELAVLCGIPRSASVRVIEDANVLEWEAQDFRGLLLGDAFLSERIFRESLRTLIENEQLLIASLTQSQTAASNG